MTNNSEAVVAAGPVRPASGDAGPTGSAPAGASAPSARPDDFLRVSDAKERYVGGAMSLRWWYRQVELGRLPHFRAGGAVLLRPADVEAFVAGMFRDKAGPAAGPDPPPPGPVPVPPPRSGPHRPGLRFFTG